MEASLTTTVSSDIHLLDEIELAKKEWVIAQQRLDYLSDSELIDHAIFMLEAAEKKYGYLLRRARELQLTGTWNLDSVKFQI